MKKFLFLIAIFLAAFFIVPSVSAATLQVPSQHSTIQGAINAAAVGDTIIIAPGNYGGGINLNKGVTLQGATYDKVDPRKNTVIISGGGTAGINIPSGTSNHPKIIGLTIKSAASCILTRAIFTVEYSYMASCDDIAEYEKGSGGINRNNVYVGAGDDAIDFDNQINSVTVENNLILQSSQDGIETRFQDDSISGATVEYVIRGNRIEGNNGDGMQMIDYSADTNRRFIIERNLFLNNKQAGIGLMCCTNTSEDYQAASVREEMRVINNTFVGNNHGITGGDNMLVLNNIFINTTATALKNVDNASRLSNNLFFSNGANFSGTTVANAITANPMLDSAYVPQAASPAIDAGLSTFSWKNIFNQTYNFSATGFSGSAPDLGWKERTGPGVIVSVGPSITTPPNVTVTTTPGCPKKSSGDADCNGKIDLVDFEIWRKEYTGTLVTKTSDFNSDTKVNIVDFEAWRTGFFIL